MILNEEKKNPTKLLVSFSILQYWINSGKWYESANSCTLDTSQKLSDHYMFGGGGLAHLPRLSCPQNAIKQFCCFPIGLL